MEEAQARDDEMGELEEKTNKMYSNNEYGSSSPHDYSSSMAMKEPPFTEIADAIDNFLTLQNNGEENMLAIDMSQSMSDDDDEGLGCFEPSEVDGKLNIDESTTSNEAPNDVQMETRHDAPIGTTDDAKSGNQTSRAVDSSSSKETEKLEDSDKSLKEEDERMQVSNCDTSGSIELETPEEVDVDSKEGLDQLYKQRSMVKQALLDELELLDSKQDESETPEPKHKDDAGSSSEEEAPSAPGMNFLQQRRPKEDTDDTDEDDTDGRRTAEGEKESEKGRNESMEEEGEEGELEEGELEDEMEEGHENEGSGGQEKKVTESVAEENKETKDPEKTEKTKETKEPEKNNKTENLVRKEKDDLKKRKHKEKNDPKELSSKLKKRKHHFSAEDETEVPRKGPIREKSLDFDTLLKQRQMYLVGGSGPNSENSFPQEDSFDHNQYRDVDSFESGSGGDEWGDGPKPPRRRAPRKRRGGSRSPSRKGEAICMFYLQGSCKRGVDCPYSHDISPPRKMELCKFYMMDCCAKKEKCLYMHKDFPCKYYHFGIKCKDGDLCKFSHDPLQEITKNILLKHIELAPKDILGDFPRLSKHSSQIILFVTEAKRNGEPIDDDHLESVMDYEGKGFRYLDRALKNGRKKKDGERVKGGEKEKEEGSLKMKEKEKDEKDKERERSKEVSMKIREIRENKEREKSPKKVKSYDKDDHRERDKDKKERGKDRENRHRERDNGAVDKEGRNREKRHRERKRSDGSRSATKSDPFSEQIPLKQKDPFSEMTPKQKELFHRLEDRRQIVPDYDDRGSVDQPTSIGASYQSGGDLNYPPTRWYSSDEEAEGSQRSSDGRKDSYGSPPSGRRLRMGDSWGRGGSPEKSIPPVQSQLHTNFLDQSNLSNIDFSYLKNVLNTVQSQASQNNTLNTQDSRPDNWGDRRPASSGLSPRERSMSTNYMDMANDIKEVFYDPPETNNSRSSSRSIDSFLHSARQMSTNSSHGDRDFAEMSRSSRDSRDSVNDNTHWGDVEGDRDIPDPRLKGTNGLTRSRPLQEVVTLDNDKGSIDQNSPYSTNSKNTRDYEGSPSKEKDSTEKKDSDLRVNSIYYIGVDSEASSLSPEFDEGPNALPFKVPVHSAKEIDGSINMHSPITYRLVLVTVPKPNFSKLKINRSDPKTLEDPRLKKMLRRSSTEECLRSPRGIPGVEGDQSIGSPPFDPKAKLSSKIAEIESRDPRKSIARDPRTEPRGDPRVDPTRADLPWPDSARPDSRIDPRLDSRNTPSDPRSDPRSAISDPRSEWVDPRIDPRMSQRKDPRSQGCRIDPRDSVMGSDMRDSDPRVGGPVFSNGLMEGLGYGGGFSAIGNMPSPMLGPGGIDPRGRPGLLGAGPSPNSLQLGQIPQSLNHSPFLLQTPIGHQGGPYMGRDRGDMMGAHGPNFSQGWGMGRPPQFNDPRLSSNGDFSPSLS